MTDDASAAVKESKYVCLFSGGMESVYMVWKLMRENPNTIHAHHVRVFNYGNRAYPEWIAVNNTIDWLRKNVGPIDLTVSEYKLGLPRIPRDYFFLTFMARAIAHQAFHEDWGNIIGICDGRNPPDEEQYEMAVKTSRRAENLYKAMWEGKDPRIPLVHPIWGISREEMLREMPEELFKMTWSCRFPVSKDYEWHPCGECPVCVPFLRRGIPLNVFEKNPDDL